METTSKQQVPNPWVNLPSGKQDGSVVPVVRPAFVLSLFSQRVLGWGRASDIAAQVEDRQEAYRRSGHFDLADGVVAVEVPADQALVDRMLRVPGACYEFYMGVAALCAATKEG